MIQGPKNLVLHDYARYFFILAIAVVLALFFWVISPFLNVLVYASLIAVVFNPVFKWISKVLRGHTGIAAFLTTLVVMLVVLTPLTLFIIFLVQEAVSAYDILDSKLVEIDFESFRFTGAFSDLPWIGDIWTNLAQRYNLRELLGNYNFDLFSLVRDLGEKISTFLVSQSGTVLKSVGDTMIGVLILLLTIFFFFRDGENLTDFLKRLSPLPTKYENEIENKLRETTYAIVVGNFGTAILQGLVGAIGFAIAGVDNVLFWGTIMAFASLIPYIGAAFVWFPASLAFMVQGEWVWAIFLFLWGLCLISIVDNVARPILIGSRSKMHPLATFLVVLGGIFVFGLKGIIFGPLILSLTVTIIHIYQLEYHEVLKT